MNLYAVRAIYRFELARTWRTLMQSILSPVISTSLYFIVFGGAIGSRMVSIDGVTYGAFIVPGLIMLSVLTESVSNSSFGIYMPRFSGTIYEVLSAPISAYEIVMGYVRGRGDQVRHSRHDHSHHRAAVRVVLGGASRVYADVSGVDISDLQLLRIHYRALGRRLRKAAGCAYVDRDAAHLPGEQFLLGEHVAAAPWQKIRRCSIRWCTPGERVPLEASGNVSGVNVVVSFSMSIVVPDHLHADGAVDIQDGVQAEELERSGERQALARA